MRIDQQAEFVEWWRAKQPGHPANLRGKTAAISNPSIADPNALPDGSL
ncbi:MAG: hypothetical protein LC775_00510 [Acidobacteria bacterium]|nr:hypothetical protein [Acidobacteriota bacterium]